MAWRLSTGFVKALLGGTPSIDVSVNAVGISFGDGDGVGGNDTINDSGNGLAGFLQHSWVMIVGGTNNNILVKVLLSAAGKLEIAAGSITAAGASQICLISFGDGGSVQEILKNGQIDVFPSTRPATADLTEGASVLLPITLDGGAFLAGEATNGLNLGAFSGTTLKRAIDPATGSTEVWRGAGLGDNVAGWARWYANNKITGANSTDAVRMDGVVGTTGSDLNMVNGTTIATGIFSEVSDVSMTMTAV